MKSLNLVLMSLVLVPAFPLLRSQDVTKPVIPVPAQAPAPAPVPAISVPGAAQAASAVSPDYIIGPQDSLSVTVFKEPNFSGPVTVRTDGMISISLLGDVKAVDFTPAQLADDLTTRLKKFINDPAVTVTVLAINSKFIYFAGEIRVGKIPYNPDITPLQAIIEDGGPTAYANQKKIYILRTVKGKQTKIPFDYKKAVKTGDQQGVKLLPGDNIVVP